MVKLPTLLGNFDRPTDTGLISFTSSKLRMERNRILIKSFLSVMNLIFPNCKQASHFEVLRKKRNSSTEPEFFKRPLSCG